MGGDTAADESHPARVGVKAGKATITHFQRLSRIFRAYAYQKRPFLQKPGNNNVTHIWRVQVSTWFQDNLSLPDARYLSWEDNMAFPISNDMYAEQYVFRCRCNTMDNVGHRKIHNLAAIFSV